MLYPQVPNKFEANLGCMRLLFKETSINRKERTLFLIVLKAGMILEDRRSIESVTDGY